MSGTILFVLTAHEELGDTGAKTGVWLEELAAPYREIEDAGFRILFATPGGLPAPLDPASLAEPWLLPAGSWFLGNAEAMQAIAAPLDVAAVDVERIDAIYLVGGTGTLWDFPGCLALGALASSLLAAGKPVAAICHGVVGLLNARDASDDPLVAGRELTAFSNAEEIMLAYDKIVPLLAETALREQGALYRAAAPFEPLVVKDGLLLTGQNPASAIPLAKALVDGLI
ncbi:MAG: ThiJ/PfpI domain protein [Novosphingobium lindaniclasticum]|jgi:putative intracellular protease/amidase|uniref:type 1 glutamine amidotransferase domain-containing protein n=1 Tax=Novosphingobium lindaniclasticum TaxID=1329895 RepID=UPI002409902C|nr:type 1 glutamine amidotransferase domain-containing protein [Novosphingobium lindaniclasticum]MDF2640728.1 ThiJ/PfpI domain protein [Novosphingobium lindaniclasticum]